MNQVLTAINDAMYTYILLILLVGVGLYFTVRTKGVQLRLLKDGIKCMLEKAPEPLAISKDAVTQVLASCGVEEGHVERFEQQYDQSFGDDAWLNPRNLLDTRQIEIKTNDVTIRVDAARSDLVEARVIDGARYILVRAEDEVLMDGVPIHIS